jgi:RNA polymerase sigma-70 factor (ECF subfamily)
MKAVMEEQREIRRLVDRARAGDREAFNTLVTEFRGQLEGTLRALPGHNLRHIVDLEEVVQETFVRAFESIRDFEWRGDGSFSAWLRGIARNIVVDAIRRKRPSHGLQVVERTAADDVSPSRSARRDERFQRLQRALEGLRPDHREVLTLSRIEGLPIREVAARMNRSPNAVKQLLSRALKALRSSFGDTESLHLPGRRLVVDEAPGREETHDAD